VLVFVLRGRQHLDQLCLLLGEQPLQFVGVDRFAAGDLIFGLADLFQRARGGQDVERLLECL
jgi:hypothetical protein